MKFKIDENLPIEIAEMLGQEGYDAVTVHEQNMSGETDTQIASVCRREGRAIVSLDLDFADIRSYPPRDYSGIIVLRLKRQDKIHVLDSFGRLLKILTIEPLDKHLWIADESRIRIHE